MHESMTIPEMCNDTLTFIWIISDNFIIFLCCTNIIRNMCIINVWTFRKMHWSVYCFAYGAEFCYWARNGWKMLVWFEKFISQTWPREAGIIWLSPECILCSNLQRANICRQCPSLFSFWINTSQGIFGGGFFKLIFSTDKFYVLTLTFFYHKR